MIIFIIFIAIIVIVPYLLIKKGVVHHINKSVESIDIPMDDTKEPQIMILKESQFNTNDIEEYQGEEVKKFEFRPETWEQFIGQSEAKQRAKTIMKKARKGIKCHFLVNGIKGHGKTTFVELLAKNLNAHLIERVGKQVDEENLINIINEINRSESEFVVLFIDEIDTMDWKILKVLNPIIESFKISGKKIKPFIFAGATINKHVLVKNNPDTLDRIPTHIKFERYDAKEIGSILSQYKIQMYPSEQVSDKVIETISKNCKFNPRTSIALLEEYIVENSIKRVLSNCRILKDGLDYTDVKLLKILNGSQKAMGANSLSMRAGLSQNEYLREYEPFLVEYEYINRIPSRVITSKGKQLVEALNEA